LSAILREVDGVNVGFAKAADGRRTFRRATSATGFGAGIFFVGYFLFEFPSNLIQVRVGARRWLARIMVTWGLISAGSCSSATCAGAGRGGVRLQRRRVQLLPAALRARRGRGGFVPGVLLYLTQWFPARGAGQVIALFFSRSRSAA
jgi:MFS family permease